MGVLIISIIIWMIELLMIYQFFHRKINVYHTMSLMVTDKQEGIVIVNQKERKIIYSNSYCYWKNKKTPYHIVEETKLEEKDLVQIRIRLKRKQKTKENISEISIKEKGISIIESIISSWDGDKNN